MCLCCHCDVVPVSSPGRGFCSSLIGLLNFEPGCICCGVHQSLKKQSGGSQRSPKASEALGRDEEETRSFPCSPVLGCMAGPSCQAYRGCCANASSLLGSEVISNTLGQGSWLEPAKASEKPDSFCLPRLASLYTNKWIHWKT